MSFKLFMLLVQACGWTLVISSASIVAGLALGTVVSAAMQSSHRALSLAGRTFVSFFRGAPLLVQLLLIYNLLPMLGLNVPSMVAAIVGLSLCTAAYQAENLRGGFASVPRGLLEAADMLGMTPFQQFWRIRAPIALRMTLPALTNEAIMILKASSLVSVVGVIELTRMAQDLSASTFQPLPLFAAAALLYLVINSAVALGARRLEGSFRWGVKA
ncbi:amino acid ABC transporter [Acidovorax sp. SRB_14]|uniref:amino acid ABC transporter permease n=1 Tax=Acidovorax sp. SRB_14 TaxID=1962699 RepID=UPI00146C610D|nr:amino acid ABC transporter permease [Acidovorax sp. SRB_14]NMM80700.1 amino acid ABC transporter [Acidovorax sp. SRB_14]NMM87702.1 amino acid ABC transporter [Rhodococcus sp. SRB_17]